MTSPLQNLIIRESQSLHDALALIDQNAHGIVFVVNDESKLVGVVTDGDIRRAILRNNDIHQPITLVMKTQFVSLPVSARTDRILAQFNEKIRIIPLLDENGVPVDYASINRHHRIPVMEPTLTGNELNYVVECVRSNWISSQGPFVGKFEQAFAEFLGADHAMAVSNGTSALHLCLLALGIGPGDEVIVPDLTFAASANAVIHAGATPVLADVSAETWALDVAAVERCLTPRTRAIMPVHLYGQPAEMDRLMEFARKHGLLVIEDAAEALGATDEGRCVGTFGDASAFSFFGNKLITTGEGGMVVFKSAEAAMRARMLRDHGMDPQRRYWHLEVGYNYRMTNLQAAVGLAQMEQIESFIDRKLQLAKCYREGLGDLETLTFPLLRQGVRNVYWLFSIILDSEASNITRDELIARLSGVGIESRPLFFPLHIMPLYRKYAGPGDFPNSTRLGANGLSLPSAATLDTSACRQICEAIRRVLGVRSMRTWVQASNV